MIKGFNIMQRKQTLSLQMKTPGGSLNFVAVYENEDKIIAVAKYIPLGKLYPNSFFPAVISESIAELTVNQNGLHAKPVSYYVLTDELGGWYLKNFNAITNLNEIQHVVANMEQIYSVDVHDMLAYRAGLNM
jgi:hypothetical protein